MLLNEETQLKYGYFPNSVPAGSHKKFLIQCDYCKNTIEKTSYHYHQSHKNDGVSVSSKDACSGCKILKRNETVLLSGTQSSINEKRKQTNILKYGVGTPLNNYEIREKIQKENLEKYGTIYPAQASSIREKIKKTNLEKYGSETYFQSEEGKSKIAASRTEKFGVFSPKLTDVSDVVRKNLDDSAWLTDQHITQKKSVQTIATELGLESTTPIVVESLRSHHLPIHRYDPKTSSINEITDFLKSLTPAPTIQENELFDIYLPDQKIAIDCLDLFWESDIHRLDKQTQKRKMKKCTEDGIRLISIFEDEWITKQSIVKNRLSHIIQQSTSQKYAKNCTVVKGGSYPDFFVQHHIQGKTNSSLQYGLYSESELIAVMSFGKPRFNKNHEWELLRFASIGSVVGGAGKLFTAFVREQNPESVLSYCDLRWGTGNLYEKLGFKLQSTSEPTSFYTKEGKRYHRLGFTREKLLKSIGTTDVTSKMSQNQLARSCGFSKIYDCGHAVYVWSKTP